MKIVILHTDFRIYWPARLRALSALLKAHNMTLDVLEIAGAGSPYAFAKQEFSKDLSWQILFPSEKMENLHNKAIQYVVKQKLNEIDPDVIIAGAIAFPSGALAVRWARQNNKKVIIFDDAKVEDVRRNAFVNFVKRSVYHGVDAILYPSPCWDKTGLYWDFQPDQMFYGVDVVDNNFWQKPFSKDCSFPKKYFLCIGRQIPKKNFVFVLRAYACYVNKVENPLPLLMVGDGIEHKRLLQYVKDNGLVSHVIFKSFVQQADLVSIYRQATAFIISSVKDETWGLVINEAMASGLPVLVSDRCGAASTLVRNKENGLIFSPFDIKQLERGLLYMHGLSEDDRNEMSKKSLEIIKEWGIEKFANSLYEAILFVSKKEKKELLLVEKIIIKLWNGRYRPI